MKPELAVFGGSFDPPHVGHVFLAAYALSIAGVERVVAAPTFEHAFGKPLSAFEHRMEMCRRAFAALPAVEVSPIERELGGTSRTLRLLTELQRRHPGHQLRLLIGSDILAESARWQGFDAIRALAPPIVVSRGGHGDEGGPIFPQVSSSELRATLRRGEYDAQVLPHAVLAYIRAHQLYA
ncbi:MAG: nicotinate-nicotinamide nucleotide adenylyltransferase [Polyangiales bacterium]